MALYQRDSENADRDLTSQVTVLTDTVDVSGHYVVRIKLGDGTKNLDGTGGDFQLTITVAGQTVQPDPQTITFSTAVRSYVESHPFIALASEEVIAKVLSPNAADTDVDITASLHDLTRALPAVAADAAGGLPISDAGGLDLDAMNTNVSAILADTGTDGVLLAADQAVNVTKLEGVSLSSKTGDNFDSFFNNGGADTAKIVNDVGSGTTSSSTYTITVETKTAGGVAIPWTTVNVKNGSGTVIASFTTDSNGQYDVELGAGTFTFVPYKPEYNYTNSTEVISAIATVSLTGTAVTTTLAQLTPDSAIDIIRNQVYEQSGSFWNDSEIRDYMWLAESEISQQVECTEFVDTSVTTVSGTQEYAKPIDCLYIKMLRWDNVPLKEIDFRDKDAFQFQSYGSTDSNGNPYAYYDWNTIVGLYPIPQSAETLKFYYIRQPAKITSSTTAFTVPKEFHHAIIDYCLHRMYSKDQDDTRSQMHWQLWQDALRRAREKWNNRKKSNRFYVQKNTDNYAQTDLGVI